MQRSARGAKGVRGVRSGASHLVKLSLPDFRKVAKIVQTTFTCIAESLSRFS